MSAPIGFEVIRYTARHFYVPLNFVRIANTISRINYFLVNFEHNAGSANGSSTPKAYIAFKRIAPLCAGGGTELRQ